MEVCVLGCDGVCALGCDKVFVLVGVCAHMRTYVRTYVHVVNCVLIYVYNRLWCALAYREAWLCWI